MIWTKEAHQSTKFQTFDCSGKISPNLYLDSLLLLKVYKILAKKVQRSCVSWPWRLMQNWGKTDLLFQKWQEFGEIWPKHSKVTKIRTFICSCCGKYLMFNLKSTEGLSFMTLKSDAKFEEKLICCFTNDKNLVKLDPSTQKSQKFCNFICSCCGKYLMFGLEKYRGVIFHDTKEWCKIWRKTDLWFGKWHEEYGKFSPEHLKVSKLGFWWDPLIQSRKSMSLKSTEELWVMTIKNDAKFEEEWTCRFKIYMRNLTNFDPSTVKFQTFSV